LQPFILTAAELRARGGFKWSAVDDDVLPASGADMDFTVAEPVRRAIACVVNSTDFGYPLRRGESRVEAAFAARMWERFGWELNVDCVVAVDSLVQAFMACLLAFSRRGDGVVVETPFFFPFLEAIASTGRRALHATLVDDGSRLTVAPGSLLAAVDEGARILLICNPHNPSGRVLERAELEALGQVAIDNDLVIVSDEIHSDLVFPGSRHVPVACLGPEIGARTVTLNAATKSFNLSGLRTVGMHFGSTELLRRFRRFIPGPLLGAVNVIGADATVAAWREGQRWLDQVMDLLTANRDRVARWAEAEGIGHHPPEGTYLAWLDCRRLVSDGPVDEFFLREARVALVGGGPFGPGGEGHVRLNFATSGVILEEILDRMSNALARARIVA